VDIVNTHLLWAAFSGDYSLAMSGQRGSAGVILQTFSTTPGDIYTLSFDYANNPGGTGASMNVFVTGLGTLLSDNVSHSTSTFSDMDYSIFVQTFTADSTTATLKFSEVTNTGFGIVLDAVSVESASSTPEPSTAALLCTGLLALVFSSRRRSRPVRFPKASLMSQKFVI
jgi:hypothetical protein